MKDIIKFSKIRNDAYARSNAANPNTVYFTNDTKKIYIGGQLYGDGAGDTEAYEVVDIGNQSDYTQDSGDQYSGHYTVSYDNLLQTLNTIWSAKKIPVLKGSLSNHTVSFTIPLVKNTSNDTFEGSTKAYNGNYIIRVSIYSTGTIYTETVGSYDKPSSGIPETDLNTSTRNKLSKVIETTYSNLVTRKTNSQLIPGMWYRITDYVTTTVDAETQSAGHQFDVLVLATEPNKLSEEAKACLHSGDTYFTKAGAKLEAWQIWYCLENDTTRFAWADTTNGKGVIYRMIDERNNDCPYDFKNIQFASYKITACIFSNLVNTYSGYKWQNTVYPDDATVDLTNKIYRYTFDYIISTSSFDNSLSAYAHNNVIKPYLNSNNTARLNNIVLGNSTKTYNTNNKFDSDCYGIRFGSGCSYNTFEQRCYHNIFGSGYYYNTFEQLCHHNTFEDNCSYNVFGTNCYYNTFGNSCSDNVFGSNCFHNVFGTNCSYNVFGNSCSDNVFGNSCSNNVFGTNCFHHVFGTNCSYNVFGNSCFHNVFGTNCSYNVFGNSCSNNVFGDDVDGCGCGQSSAKDYYSCITIDSNNSFIALNAEFATSDTVQLKNVHIHEGVNESSSVKKIDIGTVDANANYSIDVYATGSRTINV